MTFAAFERYRILSRLDPVVVEPEEQGSDYEAGLVQIGSDRWRIRTARVTPIKPGAFVAVWRRADDGQTEPFGASDECAGLLVLVEDGERFGAFAFTREHLVKLGVVQSPRARGKRGFRVYPSWCTDLNEQATRSQLAQVSAFTDLLG